MIFSTYLWLSVLRRLSTLSQKLIFRNLVVPSMDAVALVEDGCLAGTVNTNYVLYDIFQYCYRINTSCNNLVRTWN